MSGTPNPSAIGSALGFFALTAVLIGVAWWWLGAPVELPSSPLAAGEKLYCVSYAPFRGGQDPLVEGTRVEPWQIEEDLAFLAKYTGCIRTYSVDDGADSVLASAHRHGLKVMHGVWVSGDPEKTRRQVETSIALAKSFPGRHDRHRGRQRGAAARRDVGERPRRRSSASIKAQVPVPVTYADVWEFWLRYPDLQNAVDFVTIHILPYWEDFPIPAAQAAAHVAAIRAKVAAAIPARRL